MAGARGRPGLHDGPTRSLSPAEFFRGRQVRCSIRDRECPWIAFKWVQFRAPTCCQQLASSCGCHSGKELEFWPWRNRVWMCEHLCLLSFQNSQAILGSSSHPGKSLYQTTTRQSVCNWLKHRHKAGFTGMPSLTIRAIGWHCQSPARGRRTGEGLRIRLNTHLASGHRSRVAGTLGT